MSSKEGEQDQLRSQSVEPQAYCTGTTANSFADSDAGDSGTSQQTVSITSKDKGPVIDTPGNLVPIICQSLRIGAAVLAPDQVHASTAHPNYPNTSCALVTSELEEDSSTNTLASSATGSSLSFANSNISSSSSSLGTSISTSSPDTLSCSSSLARKDTVSPASSEPAKLSTTSLSESDLRELPANTAHRTQPSSANLAPDLAGTTHSASGADTIPSSTISAVDRDTDNFAFSGPHHLPGYLAVDPYEQEGEQEAGEGGVTSTNTHDALFGQGTAHHTETKFQPSVVGDTSGFFRRTIGQQQAAYSNISRELYQPNVNGSSTGSATGTPLSLGSLTTSTSLADSTSSSPSLSYSMGDISLMSHPPTSSFRQQGLGGHYQSASLSPPPTLGQFNGNGATANRKSSSSIFDAFAPLGPAPQHESPASHTSNPPLHPSATSKQAMRANHPNAPFERAGVDALTQQLAGTSISAPSNMYSRRSGVVKFFNSTKGFGFIWDNASHEIGDVDIFVHWTTVQGDASFKSLAEGEMVEYELGRGPKGLQAINVTGPNGGNVQGDPLARMPLSIGSRAQLMPLSRFNPMSIPIPVHPLMISGYPGPQHAHLEAPYYVLSNGRFVQQQPVAFLPQIVGQQGGVPSSNGYSNAMRDSTNLGAGSPAYMFANQAPGPARNTAPGAPVYAGGPFDQTFGSPSRAINGYQGTQSTRGSSGLAPFNSSSPSNISSTSIHHLNETSNPAGPIGPREKLSVDSDKLGIFGSSAWRKD